MGMAPIEEQLRSLPSVDSLARALEVEGLSDIELVDISRTAISMARSAIGDGDVDIDAAEIARGLARSISSGRSRRVINATGVLLHTNLGRAPWSIDAVEAAQMAAGNYTNTELALTNGGRGARGAYTIHLLKLLTGAEDALVVNNNAAAVMLALSALAHGRGVPVSRGELIEIGGSYRLPDVMETSGARLIEVGTTNKTRTDDFRTAVQIHDCGAILKIHPSNYEVRGFTAGASLDDLVEVANRARLPLIYDIGSGLLDSEAKWLEKVPDWLAGEPGARQAIAAGSDLVTFSGDKLLGGPQAGIAVGSAVSIAKLRKHPLNRALRVSAQVDAALAATLSAYANGSVGTIPFWRMVMLDVEELQTRAAAIASQVGGAVRMGSSVIGAGSAPTARIESPVCTLEDRGDLFESLLQADTPILARRDQGNLVLDPRTVASDDDDRLVEVILRCL